METIANRIVDYLDTDKTTWNEVDLDIGYVIFICSLIIYIANNVNYYISQVAVLNFPYHLGNPWFKHRKRLAEYFRLKAISRTFTLQSYLQGKRDLK